MQMPTMSRLANRFLGEVRERDGIGLLYETASGGRGIVWLMRPSDPEGSTASRQTILGRYFEERGAFSCTTR